MAFLTDYTYLLRINYGNAPLSPESTPTRVAVYDEEHQKRNLICDGEITYAAATKAVREGDGFISYFVGTPGHRTAGQDHWHYLTSSEALLAFVRASRVFVIIKGNAPLVITKDDPAFAFLPAPKSGPSDNNVLNFPKRR